MAEVRIKEVVGLILDFLAQRNIKVDKAVLFGSQARGDFREDSDIDIAIVSKDFEGKDIFQKAQMLKGLKWFLIEKICLPFDIIPLSPSEWDSPSLIAQFAREGTEISLY
ncbi:MAG: nucleotidyltransferase domain-containing protein [Candidatus Omnitrophica bacterium]|nr:nucleotidyltransferase domain-containing protein [Candidatus Omnitrophota bacterium]